MDNITRFSGDNTGAHQLFLFVPVDDVDSIPDAINQVVADVVFNSEKDWYTGIFTNDTHGYAEIQQQSEAGIFYKKSVTGFVPYVNKDLSAVLEDAENRQFVIISLDNNGNQRIIGSIEEPMRLKVDENSQNNVAGRAGYNVSFYRDSSYKSFFYNPSEAIDWQSIANS